MPVQKRPKSFLEKARQNGAENDREGINGERVNSKIERQTDKDYEKAKGMWREYCAAKGKDPVTSAYDLESLKDFVHQLAYGIEGIYDDEKAGQGTVMVTWKRFTAGFKRDHDAIPRNITLSFLRVTVFPRRGNKSSKRKRKHAGKTHFIHLGRQLWENDFHIYKQPGTRVTVWAQMLLYVFSSARLCEYLEGASRANSGRGLYCRDIIFVVLQNELGEPELAAQAIKDAKGMTDTPEKRPEHAVYEGLSDRPQFLLFNPMLPIVALLIASNRFRDYTTEDAVLEIPAPPKGEMNVLEWKDPDAPFFEGLDGLIQKAAALSKILRELSVRAGFPINPTMHDFRAEGLYLVDKIYSAAQRMGYAGHRNEGTHNEYYAPRNGVDGQAAYLGDDVRTHVADLFRGLSLRRNADLWQTLPAEKRYHLENREDYLQIQEAISSLRGSSDAVKKQRKTLHIQKRRLVDKELRSCQKLQPRRPLHEELDGTYAMGSHRSRFSRACRMMPERQRLAESIFQVATLRSDLGRQVLKDMITLCKQKHEIEKRPGLELDKCHCAESKKKPEPDEADAQRWQHVYKCHKAYLLERHDFAEFCFRCDDWFTAESAWEQHCESHLDSPHCLVQCDPLIYGGALVDPGCCPLQFHLEDIHCIDTIKDGRSLLGLDAMGDCSTQERSRDSPAEPPKSPQTVRRCGKRKNTVQDPVTRDSLLTTDMDISPRSSKRRRTTSSTRYTGTRSYTRSLTRGLKQESSVSFVPEVVESENDGDQSYIDDCIDPNLYRIVSQGL
ncbi:hypothetical protein ZTR_07766 [Talaromyces verruculosus]|nr:hypothetical protein ZTR_07766 [Talaromyces verruculosus]